MKVHKIESSLRDIRYRWGTLCGENFFRRYKGTTEDEGVTCKRCLKSMAKRERVKK